VEEEMFREVAEGAPRPREELAGVAVGGERLKEEVVEDFIKEAEERAAELKRLAEVKVAKEEDAGMSAVKRKLEELIGL